jgi:hypothetical protein
MRTLTSGLPMRLYAVRYYADADRAFYLHSLGYAPENPVRHYDCGDGGGFTLDNLDMLNDQFFQLYATDLNMLGDSFENLGEAIALLATSTDPQACIITFTSDYDINGRRYLDQLIYYIEP